MTTYNPVVHFEMPYDDAERVRAFYQRAFGWNMIQLGAEMGGYVMAHTAETDAQNMVKTPGTINGGFYKKSVEAVAPSVVIAVEDIAAAMQSVKDAGGEMLDGPMEIPGIGTYASFRDTEGNRVSILQPRKM